MPSIMHRSEMWAIAMFLVGILVLVAGVSMRNKKSQDVCPGQTWGIVVLIVGILLILTSLAFVSHMRKSNQTLGSATGSSPASPVDMPDPSAQFAGA